MVTGVVPAAWQSSKGQKRPELTIASLAKEVSACLLLQGRSSDSDSVQLVQLVVQNGTACIGEILSFCIVKPQQQEKEHPQHEESLSLSQGHWFWLTKI